MPRYSFESQDESYDLERSSHSPPQQQQPPYYSPPHSPTSPAAHPDSSFNRLRATRRYSREQENIRQPLNYGEPTSPVGIPPGPPPHRGKEGRIWGRELGYTNSAYSNITPGADNFGEQASGGIAGVAMSVADANARESGMEAMRNTPGYDPQRQMPSYEDVPYPRPAPRQEQSQSSLTPLGAAAFPPGMASPHARSTTSRSPHSFNNDPYVDNPYNRYSRNLDPSMSGFDPNSIEDDGDDGLEYRRQNRGSLLSLGRHSDRDLPTGAAAGGAAAGGVLGTLGGLVGRNASGTHTGPQYNPVQNPYGGPSEHDLGAEKSEWLTKQSSGNKKLRWIVGILVVLLIAGGIAGGVVGGLLSKKKSSGSSSGSSSSSSGESASDDAANNGDLNKDSAEIKKLLGNANLHRVFPGIDYTPINTQYPDCLTNKPSQNNVTRDLAVLSQLTNTIRLYGTDCNQTEMLLHSIDQLGLKGTVKVWLGVWQDTNGTTNARQLEQMWNIFDQYGTDDFVGVIVGNEVLFRQDMSITALGTLISEVKSNMTSKSISLPVASSDLGDDWTQALADDVDYVMANIHPFFAGVTAEQAAGWTWSFWQNKDIPLKADKLKHIISETGWPSAGGMDCGAATTCTDGSVAGIQEMNTFMDGWVCQALANGTNYFWFEAFDEPWKIQFNTPGKQWEDKWGLMDVNRNLKDGVVIPDCGGKTVP